MQHQITNTNSSNNQDVPQSPSATTEATNSKNLDQADQFRSNSKNKIQDFLNFNINDYSEVKSNYMKMVENNDEANRMSLDLKLSLFGTALYSLKCTTLLKPYPGDYLIPQFQEVDCEKLVKELF